MPAPQPLPEVDPEAGPEAGPANGPTNAPANGPADEADAALAFALQAMLRKLRRRLRDQVERDGITPSQVAVLVRIERMGAASVTELARAEGMRSQSMSTAVAALLKEGLIEASPDASDGRRTLLSLSPRAHAWLKTDRDIRESWLRNAIHAALSPEERATLAAAVPLLDRIAET